MWAHTDRDKKQAKGMRVYYTLQFKGIMKGLWQQELVREQKVGPGFSNTKSDPSYLLFFDRSLPQGFYNLPQ